jgi:hypothetical protein
MVWPSGISARAPTIADVPSIQALLCSVELHDIGEIRTDAESIAATLRMPYVDPARDIRLLYAGTELVGYAGLTHGRALGRTAPHARGRSLGTAMLRWIEACQRPADLIASGSADLIGGGARIA